jgi:hypothetical protein
VVVFVVVVTVVVLLVVIVPVVAIVPFFAGLIVKRSERIEAFPPPLGKTEMRKR